MQIWARNDMVRHWLEGICATDLHHPAPSTPPDPLHRAACELIVNEEYNGLSTGNGKATLVQLVRFIEVERYAADIDVWLRAYFAAGGSFRHAATVKKFVGEIRDGKRHRAPQRFRHEIVSILREQVERERPLPSE
ncbi:hypothetical protein KMZ32_18835 [Phycicoccus sp. MAQZ13P-2]|uniref:hypothetical protein n=1 Tax=Phycicoccus mangrovi TaxID=2840470 RepID=UPI001C002FFC|nr:hypothetical protein [Phycicoccus mangrovi]MBT9276134.1 hypothetical protein [Phycicoccus mangrovi]